MEGSDDFKKASESVQTALDKISTKGESNIFHEASGAFSHATRFRRFVELTPPLTEAVLREALSIVILQVKYTAAVWSRKMDPVEDDAWDQSSMQEKIDAMNLDYASIVHNPSVQVRQNGDAWEMQVDFEMF